MQKQNQAEEEYNRKLQELQAELASCSESQQRLERKVGYLQNDNALLENKKKELQGTIQSLLQSRDSFISAYQESTCEMKRSIEARDRKLAVLSEKLNSHLSLFDSIEKEAFSVKQVVDKLERIAQVIDVMCSIYIPLIVFYLVFSVAGLRREIDQVFAFEKSFVAKDTVIRNLVSEKEALHFEVRSLANILQKIQHAVAHMNEEDRRVIFSKLESEEHCKMNTSDEDNRIQDTTKQSAEQSPIMTCRMDAAENRASQQLSLGYTSASNHLQANNNFSSCVSESVCSPLSACSEPQPPTNVMIISVNERMFSWNHEKLKISRIPNAGAFVFFHTYRIPVEYQYTNLIQSAHPPKQKHPNIQVWVPFIGPPMLRSDRSERGALRVTDAMAVAN
ncbi:Detected protein of unknown function [Hibiscus syriacus]|uniref:Uncharacterized protein n=1 Tax=Hibiscus syriacus TaxID=106335 RepID=A0A6A2ZM29_HIBSY|nr:Detected protein of unknown function [Hibiscus syriacus]